MKHKQAYQSQAWEQGTVVRRRISVSMHWDLWIMSHCLVLLANLTNLPTISCCPRANGGSKP